MGVYLGDVLFRGFVFLVPSEEKLQALNPGRHLQFVTFLFENFVGKGSTYYVVFGLADDDLVLEVEVLGGLPIVADYSCGSRDFVKLGKIRMTFMRISQSEGKQMGLKERLLGAMGTIRIPFTPFWRRGPPADSEYAVDPVGVDMSMPSPAV